MKIDPKTYTDVIIQNRQFLIVKCEKKPEGVSAHSTLERIASVMREGLKYANVNDRFSLLSKDERYKELKKIAQEIRAGYMEKSAGLLDITRFFARVEKKEKDLKARFNYIKNFAELHSILDQPDDVIKLTLRQLPVREMKKFSLNEKAVSFVRGGIIERAQEFGFRGTDLKRAQAYLQTLFRTVSRLMEDGFIPEECAEYRKLEDGGHCLDQEATLIKMRELNVADPAGLKARLNEALRDFADMGQAEKCNALIQAGADTNGKGRRGITPLMLAVMGSNCWPKSRAVVRLLLENGAKNDHIALDKTALHWAIKARFLIFVDLLAASGANLEVRGEATGTPLEFAIKKKYYEIVEKLIQKGADVNTKNNDGQTPLMLAIDKSKSLAILRLLLKNGGKATINHVDNNGNTALHLAVEKGDADFVELLLKSGANLEIRDKDGNTPLALAVKRGYKKIIEKLLVAGADTTVKNKHGQTINACAYPKREIFKLLFKNGGKPKINHSNQYGDAVFHWSPIWKGDMDRIDLLIT